MYLVSPSGCDVRKYKELSISYFSFNKATWRLVSVGLFHALIICIANFHSDVSKPQGFSAVLRWRLDSCNLAYLRRRLRLVSLFEPYSRLCSSNIHLSIAVFISCSIRHTQTHPSTSKLIRAFQIWFPEAQSYSRFRRKASTNTQSCGRRSLESNASGRKETVAREVGGGAEVA